MFYPQTLRVGRCNNQIQNKLAITLQWVSNQGEKDTKGKYISYNVYKRAAVDSAGTVTLILAPGIKSWGASPPK